MRRTLTKPTQPRNQASGRLRTGSTLILLVGLGILIGWALWSPERPAAGRDDARDPLSVPNSNEMSASPRPGSSSTGSTDFSLTEGQETEIELANLRADQTLVVTLKLANQEKPDFGIRSAWIYQESREPLQLQAERTGDDLFRAELPVDALAPGRAILELRTDENAPLALRRFALQIR